DGAAAHIAKDKIGLEEGIWLIHAAGGLATMAHPGSVKLSDDDLLPELVRLKALGLNGVACYYSQHTPGRRASVEAMAAKAGLLVTSGSDFHGKAKPDVFLGQVESGLPAPSILLDRMRAALKSRAS